MLNESRWESSLPLEKEDQPHWFIRFWRWLVEQGRPHLGWLVLALCLMLALLPTWALGDNRLDELRRIQAGVDAVGPLAVLTTWVLLGWRRPIMFARYRLLRIGLLLLAFLLIGVVVLSQVLAGWMPSWLELGAALLHNQWVQLGQQSIADLQRLFTHFVLWWQGVQAGGAAQDNLIFAAFAGGVFWIAGVLTAWLARQYRQGVLAAAPVLWLLGMMLLYSAPNRSMMVLGVLLALVLQVLLDQDALTRRWQRNRLDFSTGLFLDRLMVVFAVLVVVFLLAAFMPNLYFTPLVDRYYAMIDPWQQKVEGWRDRLFPDLKGVSHLRGGGLGGGLPNNFLLGNGGTLGETEVMQVRTDEPALDTGGPYYEEAPPPGHYMRGSTFSTYNGHGWSNPPDTKHQEITANRSWDSKKWQGRKPLVQNVTLDFNASILFGAPEQIEPGLDYEAELRADGDVVALWARERNYTIVSSLPAVGEAQLAAEPAWNNTGQGPHPLPAGYAIHLQLPNTISDRTRQLAATLTAGQSSPYAKARAIETYLRKYPYDLKVPPPPKNVSDVADYFLFDLRRGYCDYYATAFVVLARLAGLPTRFASGYAVGHWIGTEHYWSVTESEAHSWPEVYFPTYGWIPFEPTAGRPELQRIGLPADSTGFTAPSVPEPEAPTVAPQSRWNWQLLFWLLPLALVGWGIVTWVNRWRLGREDPWHALLRWGQRIGKPITAGETVLEYGAGLADHVLQSPTREPDAVRIVAREVTILSQAVNRLRYGPTPGRGNADAQASEHWQRLRHYLPRIRRSA
ncbi:MAG: transglutaminase-like domain-containing protein [Caldilineaceae bacterium]